MVCDCSDVGSCPPAMPAPGCLLSEMIRSRHVSVGVIFQDAPHKNAPGPGTQRVALSCCPPPHPCNNDRTQLHFYPNVGRAGLDCCCPARLRHTCTCRRRLLAGAGVSYRVAAGMRPLNCHETEIFSRYTPQSVFWTQEAAASLGQHSRCPSWAFELSKRQLPLQLQMQACNLKPQKHSECYHMGA